MVFYSRRWLDFLQLSNFFFLQLSLTFLQLSSRLLFFFLQLSSFLQFSLFLQLSSQQASHLIPRGGGGVRVLTLEFFCVFFSWGWSTFFAESVVLFFLSELHVHFAGCHILLLVQYCWCYHGRFKRGGGGRMRRYNLK